MKTATKRFVWLATLSTCVITSNPAMAEGGKIAGAISLNYTKQEALSVVEAPGNLLILGELKGINKSTNGSGYMDGAAVTNREIVRLFQGNGPNNGYITLDKNGDSAVALWNGQVTTVMSPEGQPMTSFKGTWEYVAGTGRLTGIKGNGDFQGHFTSKTSYDVNWNGEYSVDK
jgi:hypothetical protein